jgi:phosphoglycolate phosphatase-like HAD superfamily hydrolase
MLKDLMFTHRDDKHSTAVIFDCDGVLLDSNQLKINAFRQTLTINGFDEQAIAAASVWQSKSFGMSRYHLFKEMMNGRFGVPPEVTVERLLADFGDLCAEGYLAVPEVPGLRETLLALAGYANLYVVSGSDQEELRSIFHRRNLAEHFVSVFGSPRTKIENIDLVLKSHHEAFGVMPRNVLFVGDAVADLDAAVATGCSFAFMAPYSTVKDVMLHRAKEEGFPVIQDLRELMGFFSPMSRHVNHGAQGVMS